MKYMLDTDISSYIIKNRPQSVLQHYEKLIDTNEDELFISSITCSELIYGALLKPSMTPIVENFISCMDILNWDKAAAYQYADIRLSLKKKGIVIGAHDMQIAAHARSVGAIVVTNNQKHFANIPGIIIENW